MAVVKSQVPVALFALLGAGCYTGAVNLDASDEISEMRDVETNNIHLNGIKFNDIKFNGIKFNGIKFNGIKFNDIKFNGIKFNDIKFNGIKFNDIKFNGTEFEVWRWQGWKVQRFSGEDLSGMEINLTVDTVDEDDKVSARPATIRINDIYRDEDWHDVLYYDLEITLNGTNQWEPLCQNGYPAIPMRNYWDEATGNRIDDDDVVTFACTTGVLAHCVQWGYRPWAKAKRCDKWNKDKKWKNDCDYVSLRDYHQACTRMARADYCGTGEPWTVPGTPIDIYDHLFSQIEASETDWPVEAEWRPDGAYCLQDIRQQGWKAEGKYPQCNNGKAKKKGDCGSLKDHRALLVSNFDDEFED